MQREEAEKLLGVLVFDELDEASKAELLAYLQTDDELRDRLADLRMAVKVTGDALHAGPEPVLDAQHLKRLEKLGRPQSARRMQTIRLFPKVAVAAVVFLVAGVVPFLTPHLNSRRYSMRAPQVTPETSPGEQINYDVAYGGGSELERVTETEPQRLYRIESGKEVAAQAENLRGQYGRRFDESRPLVEAANQAQPISARGQASVDNRPQVTAEAESPVALGRLGDASDTPPQPTSLSLRTTEGVEAEARGRRERGVARQAEKLPALVEVKKLTAAKPESESLLRGSLSAAGTSRTSGSAGPGLGFGLDAIEPMNGGVVATDGENAYRILTVPESQLSSVAQSDKSDKDAVLGGRLGGGLGSGGFGGPSTGTGGMVVADDVSSSDVKQQITDGLDLGQTRETVDLFYDLKEANREVDDLSQERQAQHQREAARPQDWAELAKQPSSLERDPRTSRPETQQASAPQSGRARELSLGEPVTAPQQSPQQSVPEAWGFARGPEIETGDRDKLMSELSVEIDGRAVSLDLAFSVPTEPGLDTKHGATMPAGGKELKASEDSLAVRLRPTGDVDMDGFVEEGRFGDSVATHQPAPVTEQWGRRGGRLNEAAIVEETEREHTRSSSTRAKTLKPLEDDMSPAREVDYEEKLTQVPTESEEASPVDSLARVNQPLSSVTSYGWDVSNIKSKDTKGEAVTKRLTRSAGKSLKEKANGRTTYRVTVAPEKTTEEILPALQELDLKSVQDESKALSQKPSEPLAQLLVETSIRDSETNESLAKNPAADLQSGFLHQQVSLPSSGVEDIELPPSAGFKSLPVNPWVLSAQDRLSTFGLDVDTASYTLCRRYINAGYRPPIGAVRMEEFINAFDYQYPQQDNAAFAIHAQAANAPFARPGQNLTLLKIGVKARTVGRDQQKPAHLVMVVDASASMGQADRLPLVQLGLDLLVGKLSPADRVTVIACADKARLLLEGASAQNPERIRAAINAIQPAGTTNLLAGLKLGYATARRHFKPNQVNHVLLCSDGVANVGQTEAEAILAAVEADRKQGITLTCVGVGFGSYNDTLLEALANRGDGSYLFLDSAARVEQVLVAPLTASLQGVAKDARIQVDFNPQRVRRYRLIGYENRDIEDKRFRDDTVDAAEVGSGQCSTALYELELIGDPRADLGRVFVRYQDVDTGQFQEISKALSSRIIGDPEIKEAPRFYLAAGVATFAEWLRQSEHARHVKLTDVLQVVAEVRDTLTLDHQVAELVELIRRAEHLPQAP